MTRDIACAHCGAVVLRIPEEEVLRLQVWVLCLECADAHSMVVGVVSMVLARPEAVQIRGAGA